MSVGQGITVLFVLQVLLVLLISGEETTTKNKAEAGKTVPAEITQVTQASSNQTREGRGLLETIQTVVQTVQGVNKLLGNGGSSSGTGSSSNKEINYKNPPLTPGNSYHHAGSIGSYGSVHNNYHVAHQQQPLQQLGSIQQQQQQYQQSAGASYYANGAIEQAAYQVNPALIGNYYGPAPADNSGTINNGAGPGVNYNQYYPGLQHAGVGMSDITAAGSQAVAGISKQGFPGHGVPSGANSLFGSGGNSVFNGNGASVFGNGGGGGAQGTFPGAFPGSSGAFPGAINPSFVTQAGSYRPTQSGSGSGSLLASLLNGGGGGSTALGGGSVLASLLGGGGSALGGGALASLLGGASSLFGAGGANAVGGGGSGAVADAGGETSASSALLSGLNELGILDDLGGVLSLRNFEKLVGNVNKFDALKCIPRMVCETVSKRQQDAAKKEEQDRTSTTTTTRRPKHKKNDNGKARFIPGLKIQGVDTALEQFVKFLELTQLKDWALYPYLQGAYYGYNVRASTECADRFSSCPFTEEQLLHYFNNYNGGLFQHFRSD